MFASLFITKYGQFTFSPIHTDKKAPSCTPSIIFAIYELKPPTVEGMPSLEVNYQFRPYLASKRTYTSSTSFSLLTQSTETV